MINFNKIYDTFDQVLIDKTPNLNRFHDYGEHRFVHTCTAALEITAMAIDIKPGDEVIMPSYTFVSTANAFALRGATLVFVDVTEDMNIDIEAVEKNITDKTKAVVAVHYAGSSCDIEKLSSLCKTNNLYLIEDAAQAIGSSYNGKLLGTFGDFGCISFHNTKNIHCYEGGLLIINNLELKNKTNMIIDKGTDRQAFLSGEVEKYTWQTLGSSYEIDQLRLAYLLPQIAVLDYITKRRQQIIAQYQFHLKDFNIFKNEQHNGHLFFIKTPKREALISFLAEKGITAYSHYEPLHLSEAGKKYGVCRMEMPHTMEAYNLLRLPVYFGLTDQEIMYIADCVKEFHE
jgi:dTDP-4-amino-4,6-dideoxygalactose transaminase